MASDHPTRSGERQKTSRSSEPRRRKSMHIARCPYEEDAAAPNHAPHERVFDRVGLQGLSIVRGNNPYNCGFPTFSQAVAAPRANSARRLRECSAPIRKAAWI